MEQFHLWSLKKPRYSDITVSNAQHMRGFIWTLRVCIHWSNTGWEARAARNNSSKQHDEQSHQSMKDTPTLPGNNVSDWISMFQKWIPNYLLMAVHAGRLVIDIRRVIMTRNDLLDLLNGSFHSFTPFKKHPCKVLAWLLIFYQVHVFHFKKREREEITKPLRNLHFFHFQSVDRVSSSHSVPVLPLYRLALEMKDACLAAFKDSHNSECHLYCKVVFFFSISCPIWRWWSKEIEPRGGGYMSALQATIPTLRPTADAFKACPFVNSTEGTYLYLSIWKCPGGRTT